MITDFKTCSAEARFKDLINSVQYCDLCPRMNHRIKVLSNLSGNIHTNALFVAEAPGRLGADKTGVPLFGDKTGDNFEKLLTFTGWHREDIFITNAILCNPREDNGNNGTPKMDEIANCSYYLRMIIELINPKYVISLGKVALDSLKFISSHELSLKQNVGDLYKWNNRYLYPLYHPAPRALIHRSFEKQSFDYIRLSAYVENVSRKKLGEFIFPNQKQLSLVNEINSVFEKVVFSILAYFSEITLFKLTKLLYLIDYKSIELNGYSITNEIYLREVNGPWLPTLRRTIEKYQNSSINIRFINRVPILKLISKPSYSLNISLEALNILNSVIVKYGVLNEKDLKTKVYLTKPMRFILAEEKNGKKMLHTAVIYKNKTVIDFTSEI
jgi:uracil-DNA glycosylase family 4